MTQSKDDPLNMNETFSITLDDTSVSTDFIVDINDYTTDTINLDNITDLNASTISWDFGNKIDPDRVERMCEKYPALDKAWKNFYSIYKMVDQDYKGKYEDNDDIPF